MSVMNENREGRPHFVVTEDNVVLVMKLVLCDRYITVKQFSTETIIIVGSIELIPRDHVFKRAK